MQNVELPRSIQIAFRALNAMLKLNEIEELEFFRVRLEITLHDLPRDVLTGLYTEGLLIHWEVTEFVGAQHIVGLEALVQSVPGPHSTDGVGGLQKEHIAIGIQITVGFDGGKSTPSW